MIVIDAGVAVTSVAEDGHDEDAAREILRGERLAAPELIDLEVISGLRGLLRGGKLSRRRADVALARFLPYPVAPCAASKPGGSLWGIARQPNGV